MRVLFWSELFWPYMGGAQFSAMRLLRGLRERGHEFAVITRQDDPELASVDHFEDFPIYRFPFYSALANRNILELAEIRRQVKELKGRLAPDLVHVNCFGLSVLFHLDTAKTHAAPLLLTLRSEKYDHSDDRGSLLVRTLRAADWITAPSTSTIEHTIRLAPDIRCKASTIYNGMEKPDLDPTPLPTDNPRLLCLGRLVPNKGIDLALRAFAILRKKFPQLRISIAGDGPSKAELENIAGDLGIDEEVEFLGWVEPERVAEIINTATLVLVPSRQWEALPLVAIEAAFMGRPVVASRDAGLPEIIEDGETGLLVGKNDSVELANAIDKIIGAPDAALRMGLAARRRALEVFNMDQCIEAYDSLYRQLTSEASVSAAKPGIPADKL